VFPRDGQRRSGLGLEAKRAAISRFASAEGFTLSRISSGSFAKFAAVDLRAINGSFLS